ncbi:MAG: hypothetical protein ABIE75_02170 [Candidatus Omnitrophota bacterium]
MIKSQAILEVVLVLVIGLFLFFGIIGIWIWGDSQIAQRQPAYSQTRVVAGTVTQNSGQPVDNSYLENLKDQRDALQAQIDSTEPLTDDTTAELEASKAPIKSDLSRLKAEKAALETERTAWETERTALKAELAQLYQTCLMRCPDGQCEPCVDRIDWIKARLTVIEARIIEIDNRINNVLNPLINRYQGVIDQTDAAIAAIANNLPGAVDLLREQIGSLDTLIAELEEQEEVIPDPKDLYWPVYTPDALTEQDVFGVQN